jgi:DNA-binding response OmpR family regulator
MPIRILLVEDNTNVRDLCERSLVAEGFEVRAFSTGAAALENPEDWPDMLITDFGLPDQTGLELSKTLQARHHSLLVLIISGHPLEMIHEDELPLTHGYLEKPFVGKELVWAVRTLLNRPAGAPDAAGSPNTRRDRADQEWKRITGTYHDWE